MSEIFSPENLFTLLMLVFLQAVLGFDNLLYISLESKRVPEDQQQFVRRMGIGLAIGLRIILLFVVIKAIEMFQAPFFALHYTGVIEGDFNVHAAVVLAGGVFIMYTAVKETPHALAGRPPWSPRRRRALPVQSAVAMIVLMNLVFSFDSILSAVALTDVFWVMATAIILSGLMMIFLADHVAEFLKRNRPHEVLGLFILLIVGVMLVSEGGHLAHLKLLGYPVEAMSKTTFYFSITILVLVDIAQSRYQKKLDLERAAQQSH